LKLEKMGKYVYPLWFRLKVALFFALQYQESLRVNTRVITGISHEDNVLKYSTEIKDRIETATKTRAETRVKTSVETNITALANVQTDT